MPHDVVPPPIGRDPIRRSMTRRRPDPSKRPWISTPGLLGLRGSDATAGRK